MTKDERILAKVGKLLLKYGVSEDEKEKFIMDLSDTKADDQDEIEEVVEPKEGEEPKTEEPMSEQPEPEKVEGEEEVKEEKVEEPKPQEEVVDKQKEEVAEEGEKPVEEQPVTNTEEVNKSIEGLQARIDTLEKIIEKLGQPVEEEVGLSPDQTSGNPPTQSYFDEINKRRIGR